MFSHHLRDVALLLQQIRIPDVFIFHSSVSPLPPLTLSSLDSPTPHVSPDAADGHKAFLRSVCDALCGRGLISADYNSGAHRVQAGDPEGQGATLQILAAHQPGDSHSLSLSHIHRHTDRERDITAISQEWERSTLKSEEISDYYHTDMWKQSEHKVCETCRECKVQVFP